jgi:PKD repeat protein
MGKYQLISGILYLIIFLPFSAASQQTPLKPTLTSRAVYSDMTPLLKDMPIIKGISANENEAENEVENELNINSLRNLNGNHSMQGIDPVLQQVDRDNIPMTNLPIQNFDGIFNTYGVYPPDTQGDVGPNHYVQVVNLGFQIWNKSGTSLYGPANLSTIWNGIPSPWNGTNNGDPIVLYDQAADRWMISQFSLPNTSQYAMLIAISQTSDPTGAWFRYVFQFGNKMPDYPKFGIWPDGYYMAVNQFVTGSSWGGVGACAFERNKMLTGDPTAQMVYFDLGANSDPGSMLPSDWDGNNPPLAGEPNYFSYYNDWTPGTADYLKIWQFQVDWVIPSNSTFLEGYSIETAPFNSTLCGDGNCIPQPGTSVLLESLTDRLMYRLQYRNFGGHRSMVTNHTVNVDGNGHAGIRWYELRNIGAGWFMYQQGTYAPDDSHRWMGSIAMNGQGDIALGYSVSDGTSTYPSIRYTGRFAGDPLGIMPFSEQTIKIGTGFQSGYAARWGDYSMMSVDPVNDSTFWYTTEYIQNSGTTTWRTRIASFLFGPVAPTANFNSNITKPCLNTPIVLNDLTTGLPVSWLWSITPATFTYVDGTSAISQNPHVMFNAFGNYSVSLTSSNTQGSNTLIKNSYISVNETNADFVAGPSIIVVNNSTIFTDASTCNVNSWYWDFGSGASPATAITQGPHTVTYSNVGLKTVSLTVNGTVNETKNNYVNVTEPIFNMNSSSVTTCVGDFYDPGGVSAPYSNNQNYTMVFNPKIIGNVLQFVFSEFNLEAEPNCGYDYLKIYDGSNVQAPLIGTYCGNNSPGTITATNLAGSLTFVFHSDPGVTGSGWAATINCISGINKALNLTIYLEGLFNGTSMNKSQNATGDQYPGTTADQVSVELHNAVAPYSLAGGPYTTNVNTNGTASLSIPATLAASYFIVIKHRNSIETWNNLPVSFNNASISYDFSNSASQAYGNNLKQIAGKYVIYGADVNQDGLVDSGDMIPLDNDAAAFVMGYVTTDINGDGLIDSGDMILLDNNSTYFVGKIVPQ